MAYTTGTAANITAVRTALVNACVAEGWTWNAGEEVLYKGTCFVRLQAFVDGDNTRMTVRSQRDLAATVAQPIDGHIGRIYSNHPSYPNFNHPLIFPLNYYSFIFANEIYFIVNFGSDKYQFISFGQSQQHGINGSGNWSCSSLSNYNTALTYGILLNLTATTHTSNSFCPCFSFVSGGMASSSHLLIDHGLDGNNWWTGLDSNGNEPPSVRSGIRYIQDMLRSSPNAYNSESVFLPIRGYKTRPSSKFSQVLELNHARYCRVDNYEPGEIIELGPDKWMVFPAYRKNATERNGGTTIDHTGTMGWAIRYEPVE